LHEEKENVRQEESSEGQDQKPKPKEEEVIYENPELFRRGNFT
jgi:hypothetical protein